MNTITTAKKIPLILLLTLVLAGAFLVAGARSSDAHPRTSQLAGTWRMTSLELGAPGNLQPVPYSGEISFTKVTTVGEQLPPLTHEGSIRVQAE